MDWHGTTILMVRKGGRVVIGGDGQVSLGQTVVKANARKVRRIGGGKVIAGFAGATADAFTLFERLEAKLEQYPDQLARARGITRGFAEGKTGASLLAAVAEAKALPDEAMPSLPIHRDGPKPSPALVSLLKVLLAAKCEQFHVAPKLVANSEEIDRLAGEDNPNLPSLTGWRADVFGNDALALKAGKLALGVDGKRVKLIRN